MSRATVVLDGKDVATLLRLVDREIRRVERNRTRTATRGRPIPGRDADAWNLAKLAVLRTRLLSCEIA